MASKVCRLTKLDSNIEVLACRVSCVEFHRKLNRKWCHDSFYKLLYTFIMWRLLLAGRTDWQKLTNQIPNTQTSIGCQLTGGLNLGANLLWTAPLTPHVKGQSSFLSLTTLLPSSSPLCTFHLPSSCSSSMLIKGSPHFLLTHTSLSSSSWPTPSLPSSPSFIDSSQLKVQDG